MRTDRQRWNAAWKRIGAQGVATKQNYVSCCRSCAVLDLPDGKLAWTFCGDGTLNDRLSGIHFRRDGSAKFDVYVYHADGAGAIVAKEMKAEGFDVDWDNTDDHAVLVKFGLGIITTRVNA